MGKSIDVAIRIAPLRDNRLVARRLADNPRVLCAAPAYLISHSCLATIGTSHWAFLCGEKSIRQKVSGRFSANSVEALYEACVGGLGIWYVEPFIEAGMINEVVLEDACPEPLGIWAVYPTSRLVPLKVRMFVEALEHYLT